MNNIFVRKLNKLTDSSENNSIFSSIKNGLILILPILILGSFASIICNLPIVSYQEFIAKFANGLILDIFGCINNATYKYIAILLLISISFNYARTKTKDTIIRIITVLVSIACLFTLSLVDYSMDNIFWVMLTAIFAPFLFNLFIEKKENEKKILFDNTSSIQGSIIKITFSFIVTILVFVLINYGLIKIFKVNNLNEIVLLLISKILSILKSNILGLIIIQLIMCLGVFFGISSDTGLINSIKLICNTNDIINESFINIFVINGGISVLISLVIIILLVSKQTNLKKIASISGVPVIFNSSSTLIYGIPILFNPTLFIPFIIVPIVCTITSYYAIYLGFIPQVNQIVNTNMPIFINAYLATNSIWAILLQIINITIGCLIYLPFIKINEKRLSERLNEKIDDLINDFYVALENDENANIFSFDARYTNMVKSLYKNLLEDMRKEKIEVYFQPIVNETGISVGCESLLRWNHHSTFMINPGIVLQLAKDGGIYYEFFLYLLENICKKITIDYPKTHYVSINASIEIFTNDRFEKDLNDLFNKYQIKSNQILIEITEETMFDNSDLLLNKISRLKEKGYRFAIDDFGVGHTSIRYLQTNCFDVVKIDGSLTKDIVENEVNKDIISSIVFLAKSLNIRVVCEVIETEEQFSKLKELGCKYFQGYLFSKAIPYNEFKEYLARESDLKSVISRYVNKK